MTPLVSVIIPFHSTISGLLINSVRSALLQTLSEIEVIVVDDASPLDAKAELISVDDPRLVIIRHAINSNGAKARNTGILNAKGKYIAFLDYDDCWYSDKLAIQYEIIEQLIKGGIEKPVIYSQCRVIDGKRQFIKPQRAIRPDEKVGDYIFCSGEIIQTSSIFLSQELAKANLFHDLKRHQDYQFCLTLESSGAVFYMVEKPLYDFIQIPKLNDYKFSLLWLQNYNKFLSEKAELDFKKNVVLRTSIVSNFFSFSMLYALKNGMMVFLFKSTLILVVKKTLKKLKFI